MLKRILNITVSWLFLCLHVTAQETGYGPGYQTMLMNNPALAGAEGDGILRMSYLNFFPGNGYNLHSFHASYDSYFEFLHGGAGVWISEDMLGGILNDLRGSLAYSYRLRAGRELYVNAGLSAGIFQRGFSFEGAVLPDMIDPLGGVVIPSGEILQQEGQSALDIGAGFLFMFREFLCGIAMNHLSQPSLSRKGDAEKLKRKTLVHFATAMMVSERYDLKFTPGLYAELQGGDFLAGLGAGAGNEKIAVNATFIVDSGDNINMQTGFTVSISRLDIYYNYRMNLISGNNLMPISVLHQTGLAFSLNNVNKRKTLKTISLPKL